MKSSPILLVVLAALAAFSPLDAQEPVQPLQDTKVVLRVSRKFIHRLIGTRFQRDQPIDSNADGVAVAGTARVTGRFDVALHESKDESDFDLHITGDVAIQLTATRRPVEIHAHGIAPFSARRRIIHKGDLFSAESLTLDVGNHFTLDGICPLRGGLAGAATRRIARPFVRRGLADGDRQADAEIRMQVTQGLETELDKLVAALNEIPPILKQAHEVIVAENKLPSEGVRFYRAATKEHLLISVGKPGRRIPTLPVLAKEKQAPLELWIGESKNADKEARRKFLLQNWRLIVPILTVQLQRRSPDLAKELDEPLARLMEEVQVHEVAGWHIVAFAPKIHMPVIKLP